MQNDETSIATQAQRTRLNRRLPVPASAITVQFATDKKTRDIQNVIHSGRACYMDCTNAKPNLLRAEPPSLLEYQEYPYRKKSRAFTVHHIIFPHNVTCLPIDPPDS